MIAVLWEHTRISQQGILRSDNETSKLGADVGALNHVALYVIIIAHDAKQAGTMSGSTIDIATEMRDYRVTVRYRDLSSAGAKHGNKHCQTGSRQGTILTSIASKSGPSTHARDYRMSKHQEPIKPTEDKRKTTKKPPFSGSQENFVTHKLLVDTNEKAVHTGFEKERQLAGHASYSHRPRGPNRATYNASFEPVKKARLFYAEREPQTGREPVCGIESHSPVESTEYEITARPTESPEIAVARLQRVLTKMHADVTKLKRRDSLFTLINHRRKLWLNEIDLQIGHEESIMRDIIALPATLRFDKLRQQKNISHSQQCINIRNDIRARMERTIIETIRMVIDMPKWDLFTDTVSEGIMSLLDQQKGQMVHEMEQRETAKKRTFLSEMQAFTDQENGRVAREMQERGAKRERAV